MPGFDIGGAVNSTAGWFTSAPLVQCIVGNPVFTSLLITTLCIIVIMGTYSRQIRREGNTKAARVALYVFMLVTAVVFVHHYAVVQSIRESATQKGVQDVFSSIQQSRDHPSESQELFSLADATLMHSRLAAASYGVKFGYAEQRYPRPERAPVRKRAFCATRGATYVAMYGMYI